MRYTVSTEETVRWSLNEQERAASILQNVALILRTPKGTVPLYRDFGVDMEGLDLPLPAAQARLSARIQEAITTFEPRARVLSVTFPGGGAAAGRLEAEVEVDIIEES